ncbi:MAG TPA: hypothetical protein PKD64_19035 [Pirellulaceae bacterium]|nr:hypothetical protein [Pirellulaceae bacterium]HMO94286.1 hypothetical protein [Pirellulaceae bacterium]HMP70812.1 hypothetical protein [Pirellulaceae bacterium]
MSALESESVFPSWVDVADVVMAWDVVMDTDIAVASVDAADAADAAMLINAVIPAIAAC